MYTYIYMHVRLYISREGKAGRETGQNREKIGEVTLQWSINAVAHALTWTANISKQAGRGMGSAIRRHQRNAVVMQLPSDLLWTITNLPWTRINYERCAALHSQITTLDPPRFHPPFHPTLFSSSSSSTLGRVLIYDARAHRFPTIRCLWFDTMDWIFSSRRKGIGSFVKRMELLAKR